MKYEKYKTLEDIEKLDKQFYSGKIQEFVAEFLEDTKDATEIHVTPDIGSLLTVSGELTFSVDQGDKGNMFAGQLSNGKDVYIYLD